MEHKQEIQNDVIDLKELWTVVAKRKKLIYAITILATLLAIVYAYMFAKPVYQVQAMVEIGKIDAGTKDESTLDDIIDLKQKLEYLYGTKSKKKRSYPKVKSISVAKNSNSIFSIAVEGRSNEEAVKLIDTIVKKVETDYADKVNTYIKTKKELIALTQSDIHDTGKNLENVQQSLKDYNQRIMSLSAQDAALAGIYTIQISQNQERAQALQSRISALKAKEYDIKLAISPLRVKPTHIVGEVEVLERPIKPKKLLIVIVAFITSLMFSVFLAFFLSFLSGLRDEKH